MLEDSAARFLLTQEALLARLPPHSGRVLCLDAEADLMARQPESDLGLSISPEQLAYIIYTSGSTGRPKGTVLVHRGLSNLIPAIASGFGVTSRSRVLQFASFSFDASVLDITITLCSGAALYLPNADQRMPGEFLLKYLAREGITLAILPPTALAALPKVALPALECLVVAGEACSPDLAVFWSKGRRFFNAYGPTETTVCVTIAECTRDDLAGTALPIGRPIANTRLYVLDHHLQPVPIGVPGELHIGGVGLARGYLNRPELTAEKFMPDPFGGEPGARLYRTGDLVRYRPDGNLVFLGRLDDQVKVRGFRIELGEIESALAAHPGVREAVVVARKDERGEPSLAAYVVSSPSQAVQRSFSAADLRAFVQAKLPHYMVPAAFVFLEALPLSPNGKVDRRALPDPRGQVLSADVTAARDALEETVAGSWAVSCAGRPSAFTTTSSSWEGIRFLPRRSPRICAPPWPSMSPCAGSLRRLRSPSSPRVCARFWQARARPSWQSPKIACFPARLASRPISFRWST